jgi:hypothetical protein
MALKLVEGQSLVGLPYYPKGTRTIGFIGDGGDYPVVGWALRRVKEIPKGAERFLCHWLYFQSMYLGHVSLLNGWVGIIAGPARAAAAKASIKTQVVEVNAAAATRRRSLFPV